jgi:DNA-sulfur modification-associated
MSTLPEAIRGIQAPSIVTIKSVSAMDDLIRTMGNLSIIGQSSNIFLGTAFIQGGRLQFSTAMPVATMLHVSTEDRSDKRSTVDDVQQHANRPKERPHANAIKKYLSETACIGEKFILPGFMFNLGVKHGIDEPMSATLYVFSPDNEAEGAQTWPAILVLPQSIRLDTTDGAHRRGELYSLVNSNKVPQDQKDNLLANAVPVVIVFEDDPASSHQDFADCAKAKSIASSLVVTYDVREWRNMLSNEIVKATPFLLDNVDATASGVNLSKQSSKIWSMSAVRGCIGHIVGDRIEGAARKRTANIPVFFGELVKAIPVLASLADKASGITTGQARSARGGNVLLRAAGLFILARAYVTCEDSNLDIAEMAAALGEVNWNIFETDDQTDIDKSNPLWRSLLVIKDTGYRLSSTKPDIDRAWQMIEDKLDIAKWVEAAE